MMNEDERYESVRHCKWVDEVVQDAPWVVTEQFLDAHDIDYVAHDALPYADATGQNDDVYGPVKKLGRFQETQRTDGVSTSDLILRIIRDYNDYVLRNLSRGYSREELGLSLLKERRIRAGASIQKLGAKMKAQRQEVADRIRRHVTAAGSRIPLIPEVERNVQGFASVVESLVDKVVNGDLGGELVENMDRLVTGFIGSFEKRYQKLEKVIKRAIGVNLNPMSPKRKRAIIAAVAVTDGGGGGAVNGGGETAVQRALLQKHKGVASKGAAAAAAATIGVEDNEEVVLPVAKKRRHGKETMKSTTTTTTTTKSTPASPIAVAR